MFRSYKLLQSREYPHNIGDVGVHVVHAVDIQPRARTPRLPRHVARFQRVQSLDYGVPFREK